MHGQCPCCQREALPHADECTWEQDAPASQIVADARAWLAERGTHLRTHSERCHTYHVECLVLRLVEQIDRLRSASA